MGNILKIYLSLKTHPNERHHKRFELLLLRMLTNAAVRVYGFGMLGAELLILECG